MRSSGQWGEMVGPQSRLGPRIQTPLPGPDSRSGPQCTLGRFKRLEVWGPHPPSAEQKVGAGMHRPTLLGLSTAWWVPSPGAGGLLHDFLKRPHPYSRGSLGLLGPGVYATWLRKRTHNLACKFRGRVHLYESQSFLFLPNPAFMLVA